MDAALVLSRVELELAGVRDTRVTTHIRGLLIAPHVVQRGWDYGDPGQTYPCWTVLPDLQSATTIVFCELGHGPRNPWGLVSEESRGLSMGMDSGWFPTFMEAYFNSFASTEMPIWRVYKRDQWDCPRTPITVESEWDWTWSEIERMRRLGDGAIYECDHEIDYVGRLR